MYNVRKYLNSVSSQKELTKPFPRLIKLDSSISDLSVPQLIHRVELEKAQESGEANSFMTSHPTGTVHVHVCAFTLIISTGTHQYNMITLILHAAKSQNTKGCGKCIGCQNLYDCGKCKMCLDKPKFGGPGRKKQRCLLRKCSAKHRKHGIT